MSSINKEALSKEMVSDFMDKISEVLDRRQKALSSFYNFDFENSMPYSDSP